MLTHKKSLLAIGLVCLGLISGCGSGDGYKLARVSGIVKVDGKPMKGLRVSFEPIGGADRPYPGPESIGITDEEGRFKLATFNEGSRIGAVVGNCRVRIFTLPASQTAGDKDVSNDRAADYDPIAEIKFLKGQIKSANSKKAKSATVSSDTLVIPLRYNDQTTLTF
ncbi:MAG: hypothetical protein ACKO0V_00930, partial [bacterium]